MAEEHEHSRLRQFFSNLFGGIAWGIGTSIGIIVGLSIFAFLITRINFIPIIGSWLAQVLEFAITEVSRRPLPPR